MRYLTTLILTVIVISTVYYLRQYPGNQKASLGAATQVNPAITVGEQTKISGCVITNALPDSSCTPGAVFPNVTKDQICQPGYARSVRNVPLDEKHQVYDEYNIATHRPGQYEVDHLISLELGGSNDIANLWPEPAEPTPGFHEKDRFENFLHNQICTGKITVQEAQREIVINWLKYWTAAGRP